METKLKTPYILIGVVIVLMLFYGLFICTEIDKRLLVEKPLEEIGEDDRQVQLLAEILADRTSVCFQAGMQYEDGVLVSCELSGVAFLKNKLFFVSRQDIPGYPSLFHVNYRIPLNLQGGRFIGGQNVRDAKSFSDIAVSPDLNYLLFVGSYENNPSQTEDCIAKDNVLFYMHTGNLNTAYVAPNRTVECRDMLNIRNQITGALRSKLFRHGPDYFKVEALSVVSDSSLLLGVSHIGNDKNTARPVCIILEAGFYMTEDHRLIFTSSFREVYRFMFDDYPKINQNMYIAGMDYDYYNDALYIATAYDEGTRSRDVGGYLWRVSMADFRLHKPPSLVHIAPEVPLHFAHRPGGVAVIDYDNVFVICDDGRITGEKNIRDPRKDFQRELNQAAYYLLRIL